MKVSEHRTPQEVIDKIRCLVEQFQNAHDFATSQTGAEIQEKDGAERFQDIVRSSVPTTTS